MPDSELMMLVGVWGLTVGLGLFFWLMRWSI
jgi:hypothetical protein